MRHVWELIGGIGVLVLVYLLVSHADTTVKLGQTAITGGEEIIAILQGRNVSQALGHGA